MSNAKTLTPAEITVHKALQEAIKQDDARIVLAIMLTECESLARAIQKSGKLTASQVAHMYGTSLTDALNLEEQTPTLNG
jgi:hypothetical protein